MAFQDCLRHGIASTLIEKNCPVTLAGQHKGKGGDKIHILEAVCDPNLYIWHSYFGDAGSLNDINVLDKSGIVQSILNGTLDLKTDLYTINGKVRDWLYFLVDGIYPKWAIFVSTISVPVSSTEKYIATKQEAARKDIERAFGTLVQQFQILQRPIRFWY